MNPNNESRLKELNEKLLDWISEQVSDDAELFSILHERIGIAQSELAPEIVHRIYDKYEELPAKERLAVKVKAEYARFISNWHGLTHDQLIEEAEKISIVKKVYKQLTEGISELQAEYFVMFCNPLEAVSDEVVAKNEEPQEELINWTIDDMYEDGDGGAYYDMEDEYYEEITQKQ